jgi:predicted alpha/beta-fold hydrolase
MNRIGDVKYFPHVQKITLFGFSAGAQMLHRYVVMPKLNLNNDLVSINFVISDPSTFLYFTNERAFGNEEYGFGTPGS